MARFKIFFPSEAALKRSPQFPSTYRAEFVGFDAIKGKSTEATHAVALGLTMSNEDADAFRALDAGERMTRGAVVYDREW